MKNFTFRGLMAPVFTAFHNDSQQSINVDIIPEYSAFLAKADIKGVLVNGTSGEGMSLTTQEREIVTEAWIQACKKNQQCLMVQIGGTCLPDVLRLAKHAEKNGVDALLCLPELFNKPKNVDDLIKYLKIVSESASNTPLFYYHLPMWTNVTINMAEFLHKAYKQVPTLAGIKFTSTALDEGAACLKAGNGSYTIFLGADTIMAGALTLGFDSAIATTFNILPEKGHTIFKHIKNDNVTKARKAQEDLSQIVNVITKNGDWVTTMKIAMNLLTPIQVGDVRPPLRSLNHDQINEMKHDFKKIKIL